MFFFCVLHLPYCKHEAWYKEIHHLYSLIMKLGSSVFKALQTIVDENILFQVSHEKW